MSEEVKDCAGGPDNDYECVVHGEAWADGPCPKWESQARAALAQKEAELKEIMKAKDHFKSIYKAEQGWREKAESQLAEAKKQIELARSELDDASVSVNGTNLSAAALLTCWEREQEFRIEVESQLAELRGVAGEMAEVLTGFWCAVEESDDDCESPICGKNHVCGPCRFIGEWSKKFEVSLKAYRKLGDSPTVGVAE